MRLTETYDNLIEKLKTKEQYFDENGDLLKSKVIYDSQNDSEEILELLLSDVKLSNTYFKTVKDTKIFLKDKFINTINHKEFFPSSYTSYLNYIGLSDGTDFIKKSKDVVLNFPYKDCILEGGQSREEQSLKEFFYNETLANDEVDRLLHPKVFTNIRKYTKDGVEENPSFKHTDNLLIKGNNLIALHSLVKRYEGRVKLIYIDPPYNTGSDSFGYNDKFNHSSWLTFMKNRLDISYDLLDNSDGVMAVHCSFHQYAHLKVLMDEIFKNRYKCTFHIKVRHPDRVLTGDKEFNDVIEYILFYSKNINYKFPSKIEEKIDDEYVYMVETKDCDEILEIEGKKVEVYKPNNYILRKKEPHSDNFKTISVRGSIREKNSSGRYYVKNLEKLIGKYPPLTLFKVPNMGDDKYDFRYFHLPKDGNKNGTYLQGKPTSSDVTYKPYSNFYDYEKDYNIVSDEGGVEFRNGKKPESLIKFLIELFTNENDIVLDYHLGSATTASVSHKLNRQYIGMEQMNYFNDITVQRILNTINGENEGLSKYIEWKGGGEFISMELCNNNQSYIDTITDCTSSSQLIEIKNELKNSNFIRYEVKDENLFDDKNQFDTLPMDEQKEILIKILDKNHLYVNYSEMDDKQFDISDEVKKFNREFYEVK